MYKFLGLATFIALLSCAVSPDVDEPTNPLADLMDELKDTIPTCPHNHTDSIIPMVYGMPSEELFAQADSGLVALGGCELPENPGDWWCKKHKLEF